MMEQEKPQLPGPGDSTPVQLWKRLATGPYLNVATNAVLTNRPPNLVSGGILADDMGLGKTLEMIALILTAPGSGPTLVVAPKGVMSNWEKQIQHHVTWDRYPKVLRFHANSAVKDEKVISTHKVVITTYHKLVTDALLLTKIKWRRLIFDEGHNIRNPRTKMAEVACRLDAKSRWVCTGTPM
jgi:SWI/SNF-related matrix-associated actin-dependent regulator of chromatin subfamily A3